MVRDYGAWIMLSEIEVSARLKAARLLLDPRVTEGKKKEVVGLPVTDLIEREPDFKKNRVENIEQLKGQPAKGMELKALAAALELPEEWFAAPDLPRLIRAGVKALREQAAETSDPAAEQLRTALGDAARQFQPSESSTPGQEREAQNE